MPTFELVPLAEAKQKSATGKRAQTMAEYLSYIQRLKEGEAGKLQASEGETVATVRRRLGMAARDMGKELKIRRAGDEVYFWVEATSRRRRGRPRTPPSES